MAAANADQILENLRKVRQSRSFKPDPVPDDVVEQLLEIARWTGSSKNVQPWHFVVIDDREKLDEISTFRGPTEWVKNAPLAIAIVLDGESEIPEAYDEGRVTERLMIAARALGLGAGTAWFGDESLQERGKELLGIPKEYAARSVVCIGYPAEQQRPRSAAVPAGRKPLSEIASRNSFGNPR
jgi:nitroreductase